MFHVEHRRSGRGSDLAPRSCRRADQRKVQRRQRRRRNPGTREAWSRSAGPGRVEPLPHFVRQAGHLAEVEAERDRQRAVARPRRQLVAMPGEIGRVDGIVERLVRCRACRQPSADQRQQRRRAGPIRPTACAASPRRRARCRSRTSQRALHAACLGIEMSSTRSPGRRRGRPAPGPSGRAATPHCRPADAADTRTGRSASDKAR